MRKPFSKLIIAFILVIVALLLFPAVAWAQTEPPAPPVASSAFTADDLWALWGLALSLAAAYLPGVSAWYDSLDKTQKPLVMVGGLFVLCAGKMVFVCWGDWAALAVVWPDYLKVFFEALMVNLATYTYTVKQQKRAAQVQSYFVRLDAVTPEEKQ